jgi:glycosyltransferase involved in cell wall biosynthesis
MAPTFLYVYDTEGWAIHQVGKTWQAALQGIANFDMMTMAEARRLTDAQLDAYRGFVLGYTTLLDGRAYGGLQPLDVSTPGFWKASVREARIALGWFQDQSPAARRLRFGYAVLHDPMEVFPQRIDWRECRPWLSRVRRFQQVAVTSNEMSELLVQARIAATVVPTIPDVKLREPGEIHLDRVRPLSVCADYPRKNVPMLRRIAAQWSSRQDSAPMSLRVGRSSLTRDEYTDLLDRHNLYVCTSWQEGGPLPLMEAACRGHAILSTKVGSVDRWLVHGENGYYCSTETEFLEGLDSLARSPEKLRAMRLASLRIARDRMNDPVRDRLLTFLRLNADDVPTP